MPVTRCRSFLLGGSEAAPGSLLKRRRPRRPSARRPDSFAEIVEAAAAGPLDPEWAARTCARYGLEIDAESIPGLCERFGLTFGPVATRS